MAFAILVIVVNQITITDEKGCFSHAEIDGMVQETEKYCAKGTTTKFPIETNKCIGELLFHNAEPLVWIEENKEANEQI